MHICGTLHLTREFNKELKEKIKYLKEGQSTCCHKGQVLVHLQQDIGELKLISTLHTAEFVETEKNRKGETVNKPEIIQDYNKFMRGLGRADQIFPEGKP